MIPTNLDAACAALGHALGTSGQKPKDTENSLTKALGVLEEQGVYALFLYLHAREKGKFSSELMNFLRSDDLRLVPERGDDEPFGALQKLAENLGNLLFARDLLHRVLVYARYHAKAAQAAGEGESDAGGQTRAPNRNGTKRRRRKRSRRSGDGRGGEAGK